MKCSITKNIRGSGRLGRDEPIAKTDFVAEGDCPWFLHEQRIRPGIDHEAADVLCLNDSARAIRELEHHD
jgi:hypothetical protein